MGKTRSAMFSPPSASLPTTLRNAPTYPLGVTVAGEPADADSTFRRMSSLVLRGACPGTVWKLSGHPQLPPTAWWLPLVDPTGAWFEAMAAGTLARLEVLA